MTKRVTLLGNPIYRGYPWGQTMTFPAGYLAAAGDPEVRADFRVEADADPVYPATVAVIGDTVSLSLDAAATDSMAYGLLRADVTMGDTPLGLQIVVPVAGLTTEA